MKARLIFSMLVALTLILIGCAGSAFKQAKASNTIAGYDNFLKEYSQGEYAEEARQRREQLVCEDVNARNTIEGYNSYLERYPKGRCSAEVLKKLETLLWQDAEQKDTISSYDYYLKKYPSGIHVGEAKEKKERLFCEKVRQENTAEGYSSYVEQYPEGICVPEVKQKLELAVWKDAIQKSTTSAYDYYLNKYPNGAYAAEAQNKKAISLLLEQLRASNKVTRNEAASKLSKMGKELSESDVSKIIDIMRNGKEEWITSSYRPAGHHCTDYEYTSIRYYAATALLEMKSPYVSDEITRAARQNKSKSTRTKRVSDPGWI